MESTCEARSTKHGLHMCHTRPAALSAKAGCTFCPPMSTFSPCIILAAQVPLLSCNFVCSKNVGAVGGVNELQGAFVSKYAFQFRVKRGADSISQICLN